MQPPDLPHWLNRWSDPLFPSAIRIEMAPLQPDASRLQLVTLTVPVHLTRDPQRHYEN